jgi:hypothetical protein
VTDAGERWPTLLESVLGATFRSSNLLSSAISDQAIHKPRPCVRPRHARLRSLICSLIHSTHIGIKLPKSAGARFWVLSRLWSPIWAFQPCGPQATPSVQGVTSRSAFLCVTW